MRLNSLHPGSFYFNITVKQVLRFLNHLHLLAENEYDGKEIIAFSRNIDRV